ncbi:MULTISPECIES: hypothetical protein [Streptomyces]|uniref:Type IV secretion protein Rhs n=2 Tax=Actinomycetes TaxID=1760 RepID=A0A2N8PFM4_STRNR|nr:MULTISPECIES: hypothetical protein [Streptomyces]ANZ16749.1 Phage late control gene D protein (GPD) [Streptomyces noursei ATCC 11455]MCZ0993774.1 hypothetical protein [Streptomyces noursei]MCZ1017576.1 hypothetical protein [Streptomyces noursei]PNE39825.1 hypothetical protein AOB60_36370 [Streptomyces noursei]QRX97174.1 hypothetical protein JNO44_26215 [Streptomyces noursei]
MAEGDEPVGRGPIHVSLYMGPKSARLVPQEVVEALLSAQITSTAGERSGFQLAFDLTKKGAIVERLLPEGFFDPKTRVIVTVALKGTPVVLLDGVIVRQEVGSSNHPGQSTLTVTGEDLTLLMDLEERTDRYPNLAPSQRVERILSKYADYGIDARIIREQIPQPPREQVRVDYQTGTDLQYVNELARANGYTFYLEPGPVPGRSTAFWGPEQRLGQRQHALNVNMDANSTVDQLTFAYDGTAREEPQARVQDPVTRQAPLLAQPDISPLRPPLGLRGSPALKRRTLSGTAKMDEGLAKAEALGRAATSADAISGSGSLDVTRHGYVLRPRELVGVRGAGVTYDGDYYVKSVTHNVRLGSYLQNFTLSREGLIARSGTVRP